MQSACAVLYCLSDFTVFSTLHHKGTIFFGGGGIIVHKMCVLIFSTNLSVTFFTLRRIERDIINVHRSSSKVTAILFRCSGTLNFLDRISKNTQI